MENLVAKEVKDWPRVVERVITIKYMAPVAEDTDVNISDLTDVFTEFMTLVPHDELAGKFTVINRELTQEEASAVSHDLAVSFVVALLGNTFSF